MYGPQSVYFAEQLSCYTDAPARVGSVVDVGRDRAESLAMSALGH